ncbi:MAG TPA: hypothetical protein DCG49_13565 [Ruminococcus sp.]|nr:hypothetical protein [Ruminococcus sp.]
MMPKILYLTDLYYPAKGRNYYEEDIFIAGRLMQPSRRIIPAAIAAFLPVLIGILAFGWIPLHAEGGFIRFICFIGCFLVCFISRAILFIRREKAENQQLADAPKRYKTA